MEIVYQPLNETDYHNFDVEPEDNPEIIRGNATMHDTYYKDTTDWHLEVVVSSLQACLHFYNLGAAPWDECEVGFYKEVANLAEAKGIVEKVIRSSKEDHYTAEELVALGFTRVDY